MKAILKFNLPEEDSEHLRAVHSLYAWAALSEIRMEIKRFRKYEDGNNPEKLLDKIQHIVIEAESWIGD